MGKKIYPPVVVDESPYTVFAFGLRE